MGNSQDKPPKPLRKALSVPNTHDLPPDAPVLVKEKSRSSQRLNQPSGKNSKPGKSGKKSKHNVGAEQEMQIPYTDAVFLPEFPLRGDVEELDYDVIEVIAKGAYGNVIKVQREDEKRFYAVKVLDKAQILHDGAVSQCKDEASIQSMAGNHPFVVKAYEYWQSHRNLYIVLDYVPHGDMFTLWTFHGCFPEELVRLYIAEMAMVIEYLHESCVVYRDVKMENILFDAKGHIRLTDFGLAKRLQRGEQTRTVCGTLQYMAPEVLSVYPYGHPADWWSLGILMYTMLVGKYPVDGIDTHTRMAQKVFECDYLLPGNISNAAQDVVNRVLTKSPHKRLCDIDRLQDLYFFQDLIFSDLIDCNINPIDVVPHDFFPMTGVSWAPQLLSQEDQRQFDQFDDTNEAVVRGKHRDDRYSNTYDDYYRQSEDYDDYRHSDSYDSYSRRHHRDQPDRYDSHQHQRHRHSDRYNSSEQSQESSDRTYPRQQYHSENGHEDSTRQSQHHRQQQHQSHYNREQEHSRKRPVPEARNNSSSVRPGSSHKSQARDVRDSPDIRRDMDKGFQRERGGSTASSTHNSSYAQYGLSSHEAASSTQGGNNNVPSGTQDYMDPSQSSISSSERQRNGSTAESLISPAMYMSMDGHRSGSFSRSNDLRESGLGQLSHDSEYVAPSLPKNPPPATLSSASSNPPSLTLNPGIKLVEPAPTITLPPSATQQRVVSSNNVTMYTDVKGRPKVKAQQSLPSPLYFQSPTADVKDYKGVEEAQVQLVTSPVIKSPPPQQVASNPKPKIPPAPPPKPAIAKQPVNRPVIAPVPAVRKSFNAKKKFNPNDNKAASQMMPSNPSSHPNAFPVLPVDASNTPGDNSSISPSGGGNTEKPRPVPKPRHNFSRPTSGNDENFNHLAKIPPNHQIGINQEAHGSSPVSPSDDSFQWNLPTSSVPSFV